MSLGSPAQKGWKPSAYQAAVVLSGVSAVLGLGREALVLHRLGLSAANDALQLALSITYTIALLGEPLRLAALNLLQRRIGAPIWAAIGGGIEPGQARGFDLRPYAEYAHPRKKLPRRHSGAFDLGAFEYRYK